MPGVKQKRFSGIAALVVLLSLIAVEGRADVFSLWPFSGKNRESSDISQILQPKSFWQENIVVNGDLTLELNISLIDSTLRDALLALKSEFKNASIAANENSILMEQIFENGMRRRILLIEIPGSDSLLQFAVDLPKEKEQQYIEREKWPDTLPLLGGAYNLTTMYFPKRKATYGSYIHPFRKEYTLSELDNALKADKWVPASVESKDVFSGTGEIYLRNSPTSAIMVGTLPTQDTASTNVVIYYRSIK